MQHPIKLALDAFRARQPKKGDALLDAWRAHTSSERKHVLAHMLQAFLYCLLKDLPSAQAALEEATLLEIEVGHQRGAEHSMALSERIEATDGDLKVIYQQLNEELKVNARNTHEALNRRALGVILLCLGKTPQAHAMWTKSQQQLHFLDQGAEAATLYEWIEVLPELLT